ncbi:MAG TPA: hypothetical protein VL625_12380 [Patescibacteria group bacterium]|nr:hypothetical protein [Patescibacteria group bacterium]
MNFRSIVTAACVAALLTGCAEHADKIQGTYVSPVEYQDMSCKQIRREMMRVSRKVNEIAGVQDRQASNDEAAMGVGLILFWPALFFLAGHDQHTQLADLKGQYDALEEAAIQKNCDVEKEIKAARKMEAERKTKEAAPEKDRHVNQ